MADNAYPIGDAEVTDLEFRRYMGPLTGNGIIPTSTSGYEVFGDSSGRQVKVRPGRAYLQGILFPLSTQYTLPIPAGSGQPRIDAIILRLNASGASTGVPIVKSGAPAPTPAPPGLTQTTDGTYELLLAYVNVPAAASFTVTPPMVIDKRTMLAPPGKPTLLQSTAGDYLRIGLDSAGGPRLYSNPELVWGVLSDGVSLAGTRPMVVSPSGTLAALNKPFDKAFIPKALDITSLSDVAGRSSGVVGTGTVDIIDKLLLKSLPASAELPNTYIGSDGIVRKSTTSFADTVAGTLGVGSGWITPIPASKLSKRSGTGTFTFNATRSSNLGVGGAIVSLPAGFRTDLDEDLYFAAWNPGGASRLIQVYIDDSANVVRTNEVIAAGTALAMSYTYPVGA